VVLGHCWLEVVHLEACTWVVHHHLQVHNLKQKVQMAVAEQEDVWLAELEVVGATQGQAEACIGQTARLSNVGEMDRLFVVEQMLLPFDPSAPSPSDQSSFVSVAPQTAGNTGAHLPCAYILHSAVS
jgi:hypothetical protein